MTTPIAANASAQPVDAFSITAQKSTIQIDAFAVQKNAQAELNISIVQTSLAVAISSHNDPLALLYKAAISSLNDTLQTSLGDNAIQNAASQDNTPEGTAGRIVSLSTGFFDAFKQQHPDLNEADALSQFMAAIQSGFEKGFKEAQGILDGLKVLDGDIAANINKTHDLVQKGFADFVAAHTPPAADAGAPTTPPQG
jgi:hypothetical protein